MQPRNFSDDSRIQFLLRQSPNAFIRVEFRGVGGKMFNAETRVSSEELLQVFPLLVMRG